MKRWLWASTGIALVTLLVGAVLLATRREAPGARSRVVGLAGTGHPDAAFLRVTEPTELRFPADHGPHPSYETEWWYTTGNLTTPEGRRFGYQLTFFRRALVPPARHAARESAWAADQVYMGHMAVTDVEGRSFQAFERFERGALGLAGATADPFRVWLGDWRAEEVEPGVTRLIATQDGLALDLLLVDRKGPIPQGDRGFSRKGPEPGDASHYYSLTRLDTSGVVRLGEVKHPVDGLSWMDHEWSTSSLGDGQVGWDWFSLQLDDGSEVMLFQLRREDGGIDPYSSGALVSADGSTRPFDRDDFRIEVKDHWRSPRTDATYPSGWTIAIPGADLALEIQPLLADQELVLSHAYWEGAVRVEGKRAGRAVVGHGYVELTGYAGSMEGRL